MTNWMIALLLAMAGGFLIYNYLMRTTGNNRSSSVIAGIVSGILLFVILYFVVGFLS